MIKEKKIEFILKAASYIGMPHFYIPLFLFLLVININLAIKFIISILITELLCAIIKLATRTDRPIPRKRITIFDQYDASTFPSAHTARIASSFTTLSVFYQNYFIILLSVIMIFIVGYSRVKLKHHFIQDVIFGGAVGIIISLIISNF